MDSTFFFCIGLHYYYQGKVCASFFASLCTTHNNHVTVIYGSIKKKIYIKKKKKIQSNIT